MKRFLILLLLVNVLAHFLPFERASLGSDDYVFLLKAQDLNYKDIATLSVRQPDRPLAFLIFMSQVKFLADKPGLGIFFILLATSLVLIAVFFLLNAFFKDAVLAFIGSLIFCLVPNILEVYHLPVYVFNEIAHFFYILSFISLVYYTRKDNKSFLVFSLFAYALAIFIYETGFLMPAIFAVFIYFYKRRALKHAAYYLIPALFYIGFKFTGAFGLAIEAPLQSHMPSLASLPIKFMDLLHQYIGRYIVRNIAYGIYKFTSIEIPWLAVIIFSNIVILFFVIVSFKKKTLKKIDNRLLFVAAAIFMFTLVPIFLSDRGAGPGGRHLILPSIGVSILVTWMLWKTKRRWRIFLLSIIVVALIVCQGNAWTQVVACRMNAALYETMQERKNELKRADYIVIDTKSFADNIPFTWIERDFNILNTYYGAQAFEDWGLKSMTRLISGKREESIYIAKERVVVRDNSIEIGITDTAGYRALTKKTVSLPAEETIIIDFDTVYGGKFNNGIRKRP